jgi:hypothetical protein
MRVERNVTVAPIAEVMTSGEVGVGVTMTKTVTQTITVPVGTITKTVTVTVVSPAGGGSSSSSSGGGGGTTSQDGWQKPEFSGGYKPYGSNYYILAGANILIRYPYSEFIFIGKG